jgi:acyl-coenzyme A thioesterase PaaI-like protein
MTQAKLTAAQLKRVQKTVQTLPFARLLGIELEDIGPGRATLVLLSERN